jgi:hypothetical protein
MIRASQILKALSEDYFTRIKSSINPYNSYEIFVNPTQKELREFEAVRFSADFKKKEVLAWNWTSELHPDLREKLGVTIPPEERIGKYWGIYFLEGVAVKRGSKFYMERSDVLHGFSYPEAITRQLEKDWSWVDRYIVVTPYLEKFKEKHLRDNL